MLRIHYHLSQRYDRLTSEETTQGGITLLQSRTTFFSHLEFDGPRSACSPLTAFHPGSAMSEYYVVHFESTPYLSFGEYTCVPAKWKKMCSDVVAFGYPKREIEDEKLNDIVKMKEDFGALGSYYIRRRSCSRANRHPPALV
ncbi:hypothetical protein EVAR_74199_1 [Eumeta japonica]|uniref:Uncharacterized protein n=1 Tax=Eumeta variegata TaxID=151549 RepID=A0A4C1SCG8_EUMVA|nr:hypothetical protein EVAR_74199_1 [Eumeta japonica]